ncbi:hypothetical protein KL930_003099 [Ogataea haglerorum]|nr:hypothetical protein KL922_004860 [Ogataea haglerorum]KAG7775977.1 hypothetical protein KL930_003099 [Ogataea haglerorum]
MLNTSTPRTKYVSRLNCLFIFVKRSLLMLDILPLKQYQENYQAILDGNPLPYGNLRGKVLDSEKFWKDYGDYEPVLRQHVPEKYHKYFSTPTKPHGRRSFDDSVEIGRSYNLSPVKKREPSYGLKDSEKLADDVFDDDRKMYVSRSDDDDPSRSLFQQTYKVLSYDRSAQGEKLNSLVRKISTEFDEVKDENRILRRENTELRTKLRQLQEENHRITSTSELVKKKFDKYYMETMKLRETLAELRKSAGSAATVPAPAPQEASPAKPERPTTSGKAVSADTIDDQLASNEEKMKQLALTTQEELEKLEAENLKLLKQKEVLKHNADVLTVITVGDGVIKVEQKRPEHQNADSSEPKTPQVQIRHLKKDSTPPKPAASCPVCSPARRADVDSDEFSDDSVPLDDTMIYKKTHKSNLLNVGRKHS